MAGYFIQESNPYACFAALSVFALICALSGFLIDRNLERGDEDNNEALGEKRGTLQQIKYNYQVWKNALSERAMQFTFFFLLLEGFTVPQFQQFVYYYCTEQIGFSETYWGFIVITCRVGVAIGILLYAKYYRKGEPRVIMFVSFIMQLFAEIFLLLVVTLT